MKAVKQPKGAAPVYRSEFDGQVHRLALLGATDREVAEFFGVTERTVNTWKAKHPSFGAALREGKAAADARVAESLYRAAVGGGIVRQTRIETDPEGLEKRIVTESELPADVKAMVWWLKNRQPDKWKDRVEVAGDVSVNITDPAVLEELFVSRMEEARARQAAVLAERAAMGMTLG